MSSETLRTDFLVLGSGIAGLRAALGLSRHGRVLVVTKDQPTESNTGYAQGGVAVALGEDDAPALHLVDTLQAGAGIVADSSPEQEHRECEQKAAAVFAAITKTQELS